MTMPQSRIDNIAVCCDQEECLREVVHSTAGRPGLPTRTCIAACTGIERTLANHG